MTTSEQISATLAALVAVADDAFIVFEPDGTICFANPATHRLFGFEPGELDGAPVSRVLPAAFLARVQPEAEPGAPATLHALCKDGRGRAVHAALLALDAGGRRLSGVVLRDAPENRGALDERPAADEADPLTGLLDRGGFERVADEAMERNRGSERPLSVALLELDHLLAINERHGRAAGDAVLVRIAQVIAQNIRHSDAAARLGGDSFAILFDGAGAEVAERACERIRDELRRASVRAGETSVGDITLSGGIAAVGPMETSIDAALSRADRLLAAARQMGRNMVHATG